MCIRDRVLAAIAETQSNVVGINHDRSKKKVAVGYAEVEFVLETLDLSLIHIYTY